RGRTGRPDGSSPLLPELRWPLLEECVAALECLVGPVVELERAEAELRDARDVLRVGVERLLRELESGRALREKLATPPLRLRAELRGGHDCVHEPHRERLRRAVLAAQGPDLPPPPLAHDAPHARRPEARV